MKSGNDNSPWLCGLQSLRGILFLLVFVSHSGAFFKTDGIYGGMAVNTFLVLSGFLSALRYNRQNNSLFLQCIDSLWRKFKRFWPMHFAFLLLSVCLVPCSCGDFLKCFFLIQSYFGDAVTAQSLNWPMWFLSTMMLSYLLSPLINRVAYSIRRFAPYAMVVLVGVEFLWAFMWQGSGAATSDPWYYWVYVCPAVRLLDFMAGVLLGVIYSHKSYRVCNCPSAVVESVAIGLYIVPVLFYARLPIQFAASALWLPGSAAIVWVFASQNSSITKCCNVSWLMWIGRRSFELYVAHRMILLLFSKASVVCAPVWVLALSVTCIAAEFFATIDNAMRLWFTDRLGKVKGGK